MNMDPFEPQLVVKKEVRFSESLADVNVSPEEHFGDVFGGIIKTGQWGWLTKGSRLRIISLRTGQLISKFEFDDSNGFSTSIITCVEQIQLPYLTNTIIAIGIQYTDCPGGLAVIYSIEESTVIRCIELKHKITCCKFISHEVSQHTVLQNMNGCLAVGTDGGSVLLVDLNLQGEETMNSSRTDSGVSVVPCHIVDYSMSLLHLHRHFQHCQQEGVHFGIQLEVLENAEFIQSLLPIDLILGLAVGLADGRLALYDLTDMQLFYVAPPQERSSPLVKLNFMEPPDDPRSCVYIWAFHENYQNSIAVMHSLMYEKRVIADDGFSYFENFQVSSVRLLLPLSCPKSVPITCQAISKAPSHGNEETISLCALVWKQEHEKQTEVLLFDINQWYKEEMPYVGDWREDPSYLASFVVKNQNSLEIYFNPKTISLFNSIQRAEEHFYPVSLSFDAVALGENSCAHLNWPGAQNRVINVLRSRGSLALLDPNPIFGEILNTRLLPQFSKLNYKSAFSLKAKRETLLSVALEQNCIGLLKECARNWSDGSHQGKSLIEGLSLSTLTDWLWARALNIKERCNTLCQVLFDHSGCTLDQREQKELGYISKQLKVLAELLSEIIAKFGQTIPTDVLGTLESQQTSIQMASDYQEILLWLLNIGLLPEAQRLTKYREIEFNLVPYPYGSLQRFYENRRVEFTRLNEKFSSRKTRSCYLLFIDSFIEHEFQGNTLRESWQESGGDGLYPPTSIQAMLRVMLIPDVTFEDKCALFLYFFLDLNTAIEDKRYEPIVQNFIKFPSVFKLSASLIKQIQAFWNLDHCRFQAAVDEFISPFNKDQVCPQWQFELFIESLLAQNEANLALRVLEAKSSPISPVLQLNTYLANDLISEAFHFARSKQDEDLLKLFFTGCLVTGKFGVIRDLALTESEGNLVQSLLKNSKSRNAENLHFVYLLQKYKYIEAVSYLDELSKGRVVQRAIDVDTPNLVLSAYNTTMTPVTKGLSDVYFKIKNKIKSKETEQNSPYPLSCQLIKQNANDLLGGIYHSSALSAHFASHYWGRHHAEGNALQQSTNAPFLRRPQVSTSYSDYSQKESISYPDPYKAAQKRRLDYSSVEEERSSKMRENPKKRRKIYDLSNLDAIYKPLNRELPDADNLLTYMKNTPSRSQSAKKFQKTPQRDTAFLLDTPYIKNSSEDNSESVARSRVPDKPETSLHGILKVSHTRSLRSSADEPDRPRLFESEKRDKKDTEEEKSIRFVLPPVEDESEEAVSVHDVSETEQQEHVSEIDSIRTQERGISKQQHDVSETESIHEQLLSKTLRTYSGPAKRKSLRSLGSNYTLPSRVIGSRSPMKKSVSEESEEQPPPKLRTVDRDSRSTSVNKESSSASLKPVATEEVDMSSSDEETAAPEQSKAEITPGGGRSSAHTPQPSIRNQDELSTLHSSFATRWTPHSREHLRPDINIIADDTGRFEKPDRNIQASRLGNSFYSQLGARPSIGASRLLNRAEETEEPEDVTTSITVEVNRFTTTVEPKKQIDTESSHPIGFDSPKKDACRNDSKVPSVAELIRGTIYSDEPRKYDYESDALTSGVERIVPIVLENNFYPHPRSADASTSSAADVNARKSGDSNEQAQEKEVSTASREITAPVVPFSQSFAQNQSFIAASNDEPMEQAAHQVDQRKEEKRFDQNYLSQRQSAPPAPTGPATTSKRALSESSEDHEPLQRSAKQVKGRASIHQSSFSDGADEKLSTVRESETHTSSKPQHVLKTDTIIDFKPHVSSSRVFPIESKIHTESSDTARIHESESRFHLGNITSKETFSERTTVIGGSTFMPSFEKSQHVTETVNVSMRPRNQMLDTTVDMTLDDTTGFEATQEQLSSANSNSSDAATDSRGAATDSRDVEGEEEDGEEEEDEESTSSQANAQSQNSDPNEDSDSVILLSSRSSSPLYEERSYHSENETNGPAGERIVIEDEELDDEEESDGIDILERFSEDSFSNQFSEVTRTSTSCSVPSITAENESEGLRAITNDRAHRDIEEGEDYEEISLHASTGSDESNTYNVNEDKPTEDEISSSEKGESKGSTHDTINTAQHEPSVSEPRVSEPAATEPRAEDNNPATETNAELIEEGKKEDNEEEQTNAAKRVKRNEVPEEERSESPPLNLVEAAMDDNASDSGSVQTTVQNEKYEQTDTPDEAQHEDFKENKKKEILNLFDDSGTPVSDYTVIESDTKDTQQSVDEELTPEPATCRSVSVAKTLSTDTEAVDSPRPRRNSRGGSMPPSSANQIVTRRRSMLLEKLDEVAAPDSPSSRTRSKCRSDSLDVDLDSPSVSHVKRSRLSSISSATSLELLQTPKSRRRSSMSVDKDLQGTPKALGTPRTTRGKSVASDASNTPKRTPRRLSTSSSKKGISPPDQASTSGERAHKKEEDPKESSEISLTDDYQSSRRLTRTQLAVLEKSAAIAKQMVSSPGRVTTRRSSRTSEKQSPPGVDVKGSDTESIASRTSHLSTASRRITRSLALKENIDDDVISIASSTESAKRARKRLKEAYSPSQPLTMIVEEDDSESGKSVPNSESSKRSRRRKK